MIDVMSLNVLLRKYTEEIKRPNNFAGYLLAFVTTTLAIMTASFQDFIIQGSSWRSLFIFFDGGLLVMTVLSGLAWLKRKETTPEQLIDQILEKSVREQDTVITSRPF